MKPVIIASRKDMAGMNIIHNLELLKCKFRVEIIDEELIYAENIDKRLKIDKNNFVVFASKHKSKKSNKTLTIHTIGNFKKAEFGGKAETICNSNALLFKYFFQTLNRFNSLEYGVTLEATHHGPYISIPSLFIEIGSGEEEWKDKGAGGIIARTIIESLENFEKFKKEGKFTSAFGIGGPHYCPNFNKIQLNSNYAISHIVPKYSLPLNDNIVKQLIEKNSQKINLAIIDWKGFNNSDERNKTLELLKKFSITIVKTSDVK
ncbi:MAG: D-aminoacyl-tRNA deacylase [Candidatus Pacearchaeota archaeon]